MKPFSIFTFTISLVLILNLRLSAQRITPFWARVNYVDGRHDYGLLYKVSKDTITLISKTKNTYSNLKNRLVVDTFLVVSGPHIKYISIRPRAFIFKNMVNISLGAIIVGSTFGYLVGDDKTKGGLFPNWEGKSFLYSILSVYMATPIWMASPLIARKRLYQSKIKRYGWQYDLEKFSYHWQLEQYKP